MNISITEFLNQVLYFMTGTGVGNVITAYLIAMITISLLKYLLGRG